MELDAVSIKAEEREVLLLSRTSEIQEQINLTQCWKKRDMRNMAAGIIQEACLAGEWKGLTLSWQTHLNQLLTP